ncbi:hypothetical protein ACF3MZ_28585 [Paenibacillaceae bacterium WGS1546]|uniref:hypothetical protein n=1 Tax=Cohnella sp. WGS1546 TaxID=3366810 RepID=UPI00372D179E
MKLYHIRPEALTEERMKAYLEDNYVSIGYPGIGNLEDADREEIAGRLYAAYGYEGEELAARSAEVYRFASLIRDGDYILLEDGEFVHVGDVGDYFYADASDSAEDGACHRRGVTWLARVPRSELNALVRQLLDNPGIVNAFEYPASAAGLDAWLSPEPQGARSEAGERAVVDRRTVEEALEILKQAMRSGDPERRERAAAAILNYARR